MTVKKAELRKAMKGRTIYVRVSGTETDLRVSQSEALYLHKTQYGQLVVGVNLKDKSVYIEGMQHRQFEVAEITYY